MGVEKGECSLFYNIGESGIWCGRFGNQSKRSSKIRNKSTFRAEHDGVYLLSQHSGGKGKQLSVSLGPAKGCIYSETLVSKTNNALRPRYCTLGHIPKDSTTSDT